MTILLLLIPISLCLSTVGLVAFIWALHNQQYDDLQKESVRILSEQPRPKQ